MSRLTFVIADSIRLAHLGSQGPKGVSSGTVRGRTIRPAIKVSRQVCDFVERLFGIKILTKLILGRWLNLTGLPGLPLKLIATHA